MPWYSYHTNATNVANPNNYTLVGSNPPSCGTPKQFLCAIQTNDNSGAPDLTSFSLIIEIANAINNNTESTNVKLRPRPTP